MGFEPEPMVQSESLTQSFSQSAIEKINNNIQRSSDEKKTKINK